MEAAAIATSMPSSSLSRMYDTSVGFHPQRSGFGLPPLIRSVRSFWSQFRLRAMR